MVGYGDGLRTARPETYERLEGAFDWVPTLAARLQGEPVVLEVRPPGVPTAAHRGQLAAPGGGRRGPAAPCVANPALPPGSVVLARRDRLRTGPRAGIRAARPDDDRPGRVSTAAGSADVRIEWVLRRAPAAAAPTTPLPRGFGVTDAPRGRGRRG